MKELVLRIVKGLADHPDQAQVEASDSGGVTHLHLTVAEGDKGKIIGKQGKVIKAIRNVVTAAAAKAGQKAAVEID
jgi:predicted RNA-binding protein YlqC (UPF0109 family)